MQIQGGVNMIDRSFKFHPAPERDEFRGDSKTQRNSRRHSGLYKEREKGPRGWCRLAFKELEIH